MWPKSPRIRQVNSSSLNNTSQKGSPRALYTKSAIQGQLKKRRSYGSRYLKKEMIVDKENKNPLVNQRSKAGMLTPSSSDNSVTTSTSSSGQSSYTVAPKSSFVKEPSLSTSTAVAPYLTLKRQQTATMINYNVRKSLSQMDFKEARRTGNYQVVAHVPSPRKMPITVDEPEESAVAVPAGLEASVAKLVLPLCDGVEGKMSFVVAPEQDARVASLRIFNTIMLHAWRKRREEVRCLSDQVEDFKKSVVKNRNQLHVYNSLFCVEKRRNATLNDQLRQSYRDNAQTKLSYEELSLILVQTRSEKDKLAEELSAKNQDIVNLQEVHASQKTELFQAIAEQRHHLEQLTQLQREHQDSQCALEEMSQQLELVHIDLSLKRDFIEHLSENMAKMEEDKQAVEDKYSKLLEHSLELEQTLQEKQEQVVTLQNCLAATLGQRIRQCFAQSQVYQHATYRMLHFVAHYMLPGTPPPSPTMIPGAVTKLKGLFSRAPQNGGPEADEDCDCDDGKEQEKDAPSESLLKFTE
ncbi:ribosome-binding protein 1 [Drosophila bipectinata]|uniref:ribosome-binding protein 1 n=1 Tax=Drosophila bipectinata TaxID=42026 RepID=UPI001C8A3B58|nr:uncharacterized protein LOC108132252 [Drosophila bipectinata]